jgi:hypothetical protein
MFTYVKHELNEVLLIKFTNAIVNPLTMMMSIANTLVTYTTMMRI